jgi:hypothetical protein
LGAGRDGPTIVAALGLAACVVGVGAIIWGGQVRLAPAPPLRWLEHYAVLRSVVQPFPRVGFYGSKRDFFRAQYVLAPVVLEAVEPTRRRGPPPVVIVGVDDTREREAAVAWLRATAAHRGGVARARNVGPRLVLVELDPDAEGW